MDNNSTLAPIANCFCGGTTRAENRTFKGMSSVIYRVMCDWCDWGVGPAGATPAEAIEKWNAEAEKAALEDEELA